MGIIVIVAYRPKAGKEAALRALMKTHVEILRREGLATERPSHAMVAADGTIVEVFEWVSAMAIEGAHKYPHVLAMWNDFNAACTIVPLVELAETKSLFAGFQPLELD